MPPLTGNGADDRRPLIALGHYGTPDDIAATVTHLASNAARSITGASILNDGG